MGGLRLGALINGLENCFTIDPLPSNNILRLPGINHTLVALLILFQSEQIHHQRRLGMD